MKAEQITEDGFYWYFAPGEEADIVWRVGNAIWLIGSEISRDPCELPGQFIGPIKYGEAT